MILGLERMVRHMARQLARGTGSFFEDCGCAKPTRCPQPYLIRIRDALGKQREESGYATQDEIVMMAGCGLRNGEARAVNVHCRGAGRVPGARADPLQHAEAGEAEAPQSGEFREVSLPRSVREAIERYATRHGTTKYGYLLRGPGGYFTEGMERRRVKRLFKGLPPEDGVGMYGFRHHFASNALGNGIPITDVAGCARGTASSSGRSRS